MRKGSGVDFTGRVVSRLTVLAEGPRCSHGNRTWKVRCECGIEKFVSHSSLTQDPDKPKSCGCHKRESIKGLTALQIAEYNRTSIFDGRKKCSRCEKVKLFAEFGKAPKRAGGVGSWCKACAYDTSFKSTYGVSHADKQELIQRQGGVCAIPDCKREIGMSAAMDHCHESGQIRAVICRKCNTALGLLDENPRRIRGLAEYAEQWKQLRLVPAKESA